MAVQKLEGPATVIIFLGVEMNTQNLTLCLPEGKLLELKGLIADWMNKWWCIKSELYSLVGELQYTCKVMHLGWSFLGRMYDWLKEYEETALYMAEWLLLIWFIKVESLSGILEWGSYDGITGMAPRDPLFGCFQLLWLRGLVGPNTDCSWHGQVACTGRPLPIKNSSQ